MSLNVYIDGANLHKASEELGFDIDYKKFKRWLDQKYKPTHIYIFLGLVPKYVKLYQFLQECGYIIIFKETTVNSVGETKGNCDAEMVLKVVSDYYEKRFSKAIILSGDGDFACVVAFLLEKKINIFSIVPNIKKCSILLRRIQTKLTSLNEHYHKFSKPKIDRKNPR